MTVKNSLGQGIERMFQWRQNNYWREEAKVNWKENMEVARGG